MLALAALVSGGMAAGVAVTASGSHLPDLSTTSLASLRTQDSPALSAATDRLLADGLAPDSFYNDGTC
jgi:FXSXX-COOH protein